MVSAQKAFEKEPPREPLTNLRAIAEDFQWRYVERKKTDQVVKFCRKSKNYAQAVRRAVEARDKNGKHHNHQSKVDITARRKLGSKMCAKRFSKYAKALSKRKDEGPDWLYTRFDALYDAIDDIKPKGIGPVTVYDVAVRVGAYLDIEPQAVYMHAGVRQGVKALGAALCAVGEVKVGEDLKRMASLKMIPMSYFPSVWKDMSADDVEDMLCTYREVFETWGQDADE
jgi:hypothetical protein